MAVRVMKTFKTEAEAVAARDAGRDIDIVRDYRGAEEGVRHGKACAHYGKARQGTDKALTPECVDGDEAVAAGHGYYDKCSVFGPLYMETTLKGKVLFTGESNGYHDSDFTATYWDAEAGRPATLTYASTRGWTYPNSADADADAETLAAYDAYVAKVNAAQAIARAVAREEAAEAKALEPAKGKRAIVYKGRKVAKGTEGVIIWLGMGNYGERVGIKDDNDEVHWTASSNVRRVITDKDDDESWVEYGNRKVAEAYESKKDAEDAAPKVGDTVKLFKGPDAGTTGTVFWAKNGRLGIARTGAKKKGRGYEDEDIVWAFGDNAELT